MTWMELLRDLGVFGIVAYIIQRIVDNTANKNLERYKQELDFNIRSYQLNLDSNLENYKSELNLYLNKQNSLHEKRLTIIDEMYKKIVTLDSEMRAMTSIQIVVDNAEKEHQERIEKAQQAFNDYNNYFIYQELYFSKETSELLDNIRREYLSANWDFFDLQRMQTFTRGKLSEHGYKNSMEKVQGAVSSPKNRSFKS